MNTRNLTAFVALASASLLVRGAPALATSVSAAPLADARQTTRQAVDLIEDAHLARQALIDGSASNADKEVDRALAVRETMAKSARAKGAAMIVPLYAELDDTTVLSLAVQSPSPSTVPNVASTAAPQLTPRSNSSQVTYLAIDLDKAKARLDVAKLAIHNHNDQAAKDSLAGIGSDLIQTTVSTDQPLLTVRQDLIQAQSALKANNYPTASADLQQASASLKKYSGTGHSADLQRMEADIDASNPADATHGAGLSGKIDGWWSSVTNWFSQHV
jgi:ABC-type transport system substrate-binding protein